MFHRGGKSDPVPDEKRQQAGAAQEEPLLEGGRRSTDEGALKTLSARGSEVNGKLRFEGTVQVEGTFTGETLSALLGHGAEVNGKLRFEGTVRIDGTFTGEITTNDLLIIGEGAKIAAKISCGSAVVNGEVTGDITASDSVELHGPARVRGDIATPSLTIDKGAVFDGISKMESGGMNVGSLNRRDGAKRSGLGV
jgi:cytoskeletal protein CcmA (bactofilin family)